MWPKQSRHAKSTCVDVRQINSSFQSRTSESKRAFRFTVRGLCLVVPSVRPGSVWVRR